MLIKLRICFVLLLTSMIFMGVRVNGQNKYPFQDPALDVEKRVDNIVSLMTLDEKINYVLSSKVDRLGIPSPGSSEGIHQTVIRSMMGPGQSIPTTSFCQVYGMGSTWDTELIQQAGKVVGYEARYVSQNDKYKRGTLVLWGPTSDLARDPRWGRNDESFSEDAFMTGSMVTAYIRGMQGDDPNYWQAASLLKHVFANSNETTRGRSSSNFDERLMREYYSKPFRMGFTQGGARSYMAAYNAWNGVPMHVNPVLKNVVGDEWGANWIITSDAGGISTIVNGHKYMDKAEEAFAASLKLGMNNYLEFGNVDSLLRLALDKHLLTEKDFDAAIRGKLKTTLKLGLLDPEENNPYTQIGKGDQPDPWTTEKHKNTALKVAEESVVLLKNANDLLPLKKDELNSIAVVGPRAANVLFDFYSGSTPYAISVLDGIKDKVGDRIEINYAENNEYNAAVEAAKKSDVAIVVIGNDPMCGTPAAQLGMAFNDDISTKPCLECGDGREGRDRQSIDLPSEDLVKEVMAVNPNTIVVLISSFPYAINWSQENAPAILHITHAAQEQGNAVANVLFGDYNPAGRLVQTWPKGLEQLPRMMEYNIRNGRTYQYFKSEPLYAFGFGLSYSDFAYSNFKVNQSEAKSGDVIIVKVDVKNDSRIDGEEVVQLYAQYPDSKVERPQKQLIGFKRVNIGAGQTKIVEIPVSVDEFAFWNENSDGFELEKGKINLLVGSSSDKINDKTTVTIK